MSDNVNPGSAYDRLPGPIVEKLSKLVVRVHRVLVLRGLLAVSAVAMGAILIIMAIDASFMIMSDSVRWLMSGVGLLAALGMGYWRLYRPLRRRFSIDGIARLVELRHPELQERISSVVELLGSDEAAEFLGSRQLIEELAKEAINDVHAVTPAQEFTTRSAKPYLVASCAFMGVLIIVFLLWPGQVSRLFARAIAPYADIGNAYASKMTIVPGSVRICAGDSVTIDVSVAIRGIKRAQLYREDPDGSESIERMNAAVNTAADSFPRFSITFPAVTRSFKYRVRADTALSGTYAISVVDRPAVEEMNVQYEYPGYTKLSPLSESSAPGDIAAVAGTRVTLMMKLNKPVRSSELILNGENVPSASEAVNDTAMAGPWAFTMKGAESGTWSIRLVDSHGYENEVVEYKLRAIKDQSPVVQIADPVETKLRLKPADILPLSYIVRDDYGVDGVDLMVGADDGRPERVTRGAPLKLEDKLGMWGGKMVLSLSELGLNNAQTATVQLRATDNMPPSLNGPQHGESKVLTIEIDLHAKSLAQQILEQQRKEIEAALANTLKLLEESRQETQSNVDQLAKEDPVSPELASQMQEIHDQIAKAEATMRDVAEAVGSTAFRALEEEAQEIVEKDVVPAREAAAMTTLSDKPSERAEQAKTVVKEVDEAIAGIKDMMKDIESVHEQAKTIAGMHELANKEFDMAQQAAESAADEARQSKTQGWEDEQKRIASEIAKMLQENAEAFETQLDAEQKDASAIAASADELAEKQDDIEKIFDKLDEQASLEKIKEALIKEIAEEQKQIAHDAKEMTQQAKHEGSPKQHEDANKATQHAQVASAALHKEQLEQALKAAQQAMQAMEHAAQPSKQTEQEEPHAGQPKEGQPKEGQPHAGQPKAGEPKEGQPHAGQPKAGEPKEGQPHAGQPKAGQPHAGQPHAGQPKAGEPKEGEPHQGSPQVSQQAKALASRQGEVVKQLESLAKGNIEEALAQAQKSIGKQASELAQHATQLKQDAKDLGLSDAAKQNAESAAAQLAMASKQAAQAAQHMSQAKQQAQPGEPHEGQPGHPQPGEPQPGQPQPGQPQPGQPQPGQPQPGQPGQPGQEQSQQQAQQARQQMQAAQGGMKQAAKSLRQLAKDLSQQQASATTPAGKMMDPQQMASAFENASDATAQADDPAMASQSAQQAAQALSAMAQNAAQQMGMMSSQTTEPKGKAARGPGRRGVLDMGTVPKLSRRSTLSGDDWVKLKGGPASDAADVMVESVPEEYRDMVKRYFDELARQGSNEER